MLRDVQQWDELAMGSSEAPEYHGVYIHREDPDRVLIITRFRSKEHADAFVDTGLVDRFNERLLSCTSATTVLEGYDLYYGIGPGGRRVVFGQEG